jgi:dihydroflavonol-4-reductase
MTILVTGGTGFIGSAILRELAFFGVPVRAIYRKFVPPDLADLQVEWIAGDILDPVSLRYALEGCDQVYHIAGYRGMRSQEEEVIHATNVEGTKNIFEAALAMGVHRVVYTASLMGLGVNPHGSPPANEEVVYNLENVQSPFMRAKHEAELVVADFVERGLDIVSVYPGFCAGPGDRHINSSRLILAYLRGLLPGYPSGGLCQVDVRDVAHVHVLAMQQGSTGQKYLVPGHNVTHQAVFTTLARITGRRAPTMQIPVAMLAIGGQVMGRITKNSLIDPTTIELLHYTWWYDDTLSRKTFGIEYRPLELTLRDATVWFANRGYIRQSQAGKALIEQPALLPAPREETPSTNNS